MKYIIWIVLLLTLSINWIFADNKHNQTSEFGEIQHYDFNLKVEMKNGKAYASWKEFENVEKLKWYKFVYSKTNKNLKYPNDTSEYVWNNASITSHYQYLEIGKYYVRLCAITYSNKRYCSNVKTIEIKDKSNLYKKSTINNAGKRKTDTYNKNYIKNKNTVSNNELSIEKKKRIDLIAAQLIKRLEKRKYSNERIVQIIEKINTRLEELKSKPRIKDIASYLIIVLDEYKEKYENNFWALENILNEY